jgi:hypothetical protein
MRLMRVHADRKPRTGELRGHPFRLRLFGRVTGGKDAEDMCDPRLPSAREHVVQVGREHRIGEVAVGIDHGLRVMHDAHAANTLLSDGPTGRRYTRVRRDATYLTRIPGSAPSSTDRSSGRPSSPEAARIMPFDSMPISFAGFRLATITIVRPTS